MFRSRIFCRVGLAVALALTFGARSASADFLSDLGTPNSQISGFTGPFAHVDVSLSGQTATITFTSLTSGGNIYLMGDGSTVAVQINASSFTVGTITGSNSGTGFVQGGPAGQPQFTSVGSQTVDGFGVFNEVIDSFNGFGNSSDTVTFTVTNTSGTPWASPNDVLTLNASGYDAAAHIFVTSSPANASNTALATGFAAEVPGPTTAPPGVPEPSTMVIAALGALGFLGYGLRKHLKERS